MSSGLEGVPSHPTCRSSNRRDFTWRSISRRQHRSAFLCRMCSSPGPTRCANEAPRVHHAARPARRPLRLRARSRRARSSLSACGASACLCLLLRAIRKLRRASWHSCRDYRTTAGPWAVTCASTFAGPLASLTGFSVQEFGLRAKSFELLKELSPRITRVAVLRDSMTTGGIAQFAAVQTAAPALGVESIAIDLHDADEIERTVVAFAHQPNGGLIVTAAARAELHRELILKLAARQRLP